jgi:hypothetical protein
MLNPRIWRKQMPTAKIYADFQNLDDFNRLRLTSAGTLEDLENQEIELKEGLSLTFYTDDADDHGQPDELRVEGSTHYNEDEQCWVASINWSAIRHASEEKSRDSLIALHAADGGDD